MKLRLKILLALLISIAFGYLSFFALYILGEAFLLKHISEPYTYNSFVLGFLVFCILISLLLFYMLIGKRIRYIIYLSRQIIDDPEKIVVKGNDELGILAGKIKMMFSEIEEAHGKEKKAEQDRYNLITSLSHDIRTPLTAIIGYLELARENARDNEYIDIAYKRSKQLSFLANSLFDYVKITNSEYKPEFVNFDLSLLLRQLSVEYSVPFSSKGISFDSMIPESKIMVYADANSVYRIFDNLFQNSLRYASTYLAIEVHSDGKNVLVSFMNDTERQFEADKVFEKFYKGDGVNYDSSGLGLYISRSLTEANNGQMKIGFRDNVFTIEISLSCKTQKS